MRLFLTIISFAIILESLAQPLGVINEPRKQQVIIRTGAASGYAVAGRLKEGQKFKYWPKDASDWWYVETITSGSRPVTGFVSKNQIQPYYEISSGNCDCNGFSKDQKVILSQK